MGDNRDGARSGGTTGHHPIHAGIRGACGGKSGGNHRHSPNQGDSPNRHIFHARGSCVAGRAGEPAELAVPTG